MLAVLIQLSCPRCQTGNRVPVSDKNSTPPRCGRCHEPLFTHFAVIFGYVYVLANSAMPGLLKIGHTTGSLQKRIDQLSGPTSIPQPFTLEACFLAQPPRSDERLVHEALAAFRRPGREFFAVDLQQAIAQCERVLNRRPDYLRTKDGKFYEF